MAERQVYLHLTAPFGIDRRDSAIAKRYSGILYELENFLTHNGSLEVREGNIRLHSTALNYGYRVLALFRYYGLNSLEEPIKEFYAAVDGETSALLKKWTGTEWKTLTLPPGISLSPQSITGSRRPSLSNFEQFKDRVYYTNHTEPVLMIKKEDDQVYEAGIPEANAEQVIDDCETLDGWTAYSETTPGSGTFTEGTTNYNGFYSDGGFDRHTEGDYGITVEELRSGAAFKLIKQFTTPLNLDWFYITNQGTIASTNTEGVKLVSTSSLFTNAHVGSWIKTSSGATAIITEIESPTVAYTTKLSGGSGIYTKDETFTIGSYSSEYDYIAIDIFRFTKIDIDRLWLELSSCQPSSNGTFAYGHRVVIYQDADDFEEYGLNQRTMLSAWAVNNFSNALFFGRFRKRWFIPIDNPVGSGSSGNTLVDSVHTFPSSVVGKTIINTYTGRIGKVTGVSLDGHTITTYSATGNMSWQVGSGRYYRIIDDWSTISSICLLLKNNPQSSGSGEARITFDNVRLLKTPPLPSELKIQIATCDAIELWTTGYVFSELGAAVEDDYWRATEGVSCKKIPNGVWARYDFIGVKDFSRYGPDSPWSDSDMLVFDIGGSKSGLLSSIMTTIRFYDENNNVAQAVFAAANDWAAPQQRSIYMQDFFYCKADNSNSTVIDDKETGGSSEYLEVTMVDGKPTYTPASFRWDKVKCIAIKNFGLGTHIYIDNIRIQPPTSSKMINKFMPLDLMVFDAFSRGVEAKFGQNSFVDTAVDWLFHAYAKFTRQVVGQGRVVFPEYQHGRYMISDNYALASLQMQVDAGGSLSMTFIQNNDLTEYEDFNFNLNSMWAPKQQNPDSTQQWWGVDWVEIPATDNDKFSIWISTPDVTAISHIIFRWYCNADASWEKSGFIHSSGGIVPSSNSKILRWTGGNFTRDLVGRHVMNERTGKSGIVTFFINRNCLMTSGVTWNNGDSFTIDRFPYGKTSPNRKGYRFNFRTGSLDGVGGRPKPDKDNYYEYVLDVHQMYGKVGKGFQKGIKTLQKYPMENEESIVAARELLNDYGLQFVYKETEGESKGWWKAIVTWRRGDCTFHSGSESPWASWQCIAAHEIIVRASSKKDCIVNFQDFMITKEGGVTGNQIQYKVKMEDEMGYLGPASDASYPITVKGADVRLSDIYVPYDTRIKRKRLYRTDSTGTFRYLDTIDRLDTSYIDQIPEELLGPAIEEDVYRPPRCAHIRKVDNRMAYIDCYDRRKTRRSSRIHLSLPFIPHQCRDADCFDLNPDDGQKVVWCEWYYGHLIVWKERSLYVIDPNTYEISPRDLTIGCIAPLSVASIPDGGFAWLSHEGVVFGDHTRIEREIGEQIWPDLQKYTFDQLSHAVGWYHDRYYYIFLGYDKVSDEEGYKYNTKGYACYLPTGTWASISGWNVQCVSIWRGGTDNNEICTGSAFGYVNRLFYGETDLADLNTATPQKIRSVLRTLDYDFDKPQSDKYLNWIIFHAKNLSSDPTRKGLLTFTPYYDQMPTKALDDEQIMHNYYKKYDLCQDPGYESGTTLIGFRMTGINRYAIKGITIDVTDQGFRPFQEHGQY